MDLDLRDYQEGAVGSARDHIRAGRRRIVICAPTGAGKTIVGAYLARAAVAKSQTVQFIVDRISLIEQTSDTFERAGIEHGVMQGGHWRHRPNALAQVCSVQTLNKRSRGPARLNLVDECHTVHKLVAGMLAANHEHDNVWLGLSATPFTKGLGRHYDAIVNVTTTNQLISDGWLVPFRILAGVEPNMEGVKVVAGEFEGKETEERALKVVGDVVQEYIKHGESRKFICSAVDTAHVEELARQFLAAGINVATYTYRDSDEDRAETLAEYRREDSTIRGLITVTAASKGFDCAGIRCVIMARPLRKSLAEFIQFLGRGLRPDEVHEKTDCLVLDHSGNCQRFWNDWQNFFEHGWDYLDDGTKPKEKAKPDEKPPLEPVKCPKCRTLHNPRPVCPNCGHQYPKKQAVEHVYGTLKELLASGNNAAIVRDVWPQIASYARWARPEDPVKAKKMALALYKDMTGKWPTMDFDHTPQVDVSQAVQGKIRSLQIRNSHRRQA